MRGAFVTDRFASGPSYHYIENVDCQNYADGDQADYTVHESAFGLQHYFTWQLFCIGRDSSCALP